MASFTDEILTPNPYVAVNPVDMMVKVGTYKQDQYNQGLQKAQGYIDKIIGLDIAKDPIKQYANQQLSKLKEGITNNLSGDFSNQRIVSQIGGASNALFRDPVIQNGVTSTASMRNGFLEIDKARKEGKSSISNEEYYKNKVGLWLGDGQQDTVFNDNYTPYTDVSKKLLDLSKEIGVDVQDIQQLYQTDSQGKLLKDAQGNPIWNPIMVQEKLKGKDPDKIFKLFKTALTPNDYQQLGIDGWYNGRGWTPEQLMNNVDQSYKASYDYASKTLFDKQLQLVDESNKNVKDQAKIDSLTESIAELQSTPPQIQASREQAIQDAFNNPDAAKASIYTNNYLRGMSQGLSSSEHSRSFSVSPLWTVTMDQNKLNRDIQRDRIADEKWAQEFQLDKDKFDFDKEKSALEFKLRYGYAPNGIDVPPNLDTNKIGDINQLKDNYSENVQQLNDINYKITFEYFKSINPTLSDEAIRQSISVYAKGNDEVINSASGDINSFTTRFASKQMEKWKANPQDVPFELRELFGRQNKTLKTTTLQSNQIKESLEYAKTQSRLQGIDILGTDNILKSVKPTSVTVNNQSINLTQSDILDLAYSNPLSDAGLSGSSFLSKEQQSLVEGAKTRLKAKFGNEYQKVVDDIFRRGKEIGTSISNPEVAKAVSMISDKRLQNTLRLQSEFIHNNGFIPSPKRFPLSRGKENEDMFNTKVTSILNNYTANLNEEPNFNKEDYQKAFLSDKAATIDVVVNPPTSQNGSPTYDLNINLSNGKTKPFRINQSEANLFGVPTNISFNVPE